MMAPLKSGIWFLIVSATLSCGGALTRDSSDGGVVPGATCSSDAGSVPGDDGCNTCSCTDNVWVCTDRACPDTCKRGETKPADDDCNTCTCPTGRWVCTTKACPPPTGKQCGGWVGDTCTPQEYCAYVPGQHCGAADASADCRLRPKGCNLISAPVCGCDGKTYGNACSANMAGTGILREGACPASVSATGDDELGP